MALNREDIQRRLESADGPADLSGLDLRGADLSRLDLRGVRLARADLSSADLRWTVLEGADLHATVLRRADARWAILRGASLRQADLTRANLGWADLAGADLTSAELEGAALDNVDLAEVLVERPRRTPRLGGAGDGLSGWGDALGDLRERIPGAGTLTASPASLAAAALFVLALVHLWGWLWRRAYLLRGFDLRGENVVRLADGANLPVGVTEVLGPTALLLLLSPVIVLALVLVAAFVLVLPAAFYWLARRLLRDVPAPPGRPLVIGGLFVAFFVSFVLLIPTAAAAASGLGGTLPRGGTLSAVTDLWRLGSWPRRLGLLVVVLGAGYPLWLAAREGARRLSQATLPTSWRLRYPALNSAATAARTHPWVTGARPVDPEERQRGLWAAAALVALLGTVLAGVGEVHAYRDMCDGGDLQRVQLYAELPEDDDGRAFEPTLNPRAICTRLLAETDEAYYVFYPCATQPGNDVGQRVADVRIFAREDVGFMDETRSEHRCPTCEDGCLGTERALFDPLELRVAGPMQQVAPDAGTLMLDASDPAFEGPDGLGTIRVGERTRVLQNGERITLEDMAELAQEVDAGAEPEPLMLEAYGRRVDVDDDGEGSYLDARVVRVIIEQPDERPQPTAATPSGGSLVVDLSDPRNPILSGQGWTEGQQIRIDLVRAPPGIDPLEAPPTKIHELVVPEGLGGAFDAPLTFNPQWPTGPNMKVIARDPESGVATISDATWLSAPPPTLTPPPSPVPTIVSEGTSTPDPDDDDDDDEATETPAPTFTPEPLPSNTPFPSRAGVPAPGRAPTCEDPDDFEFDDGRGFQKEVRVGLGAGNAVLQERNFCSPFDIDLAYFPVKAGRWYRVFTENLGPGVDTVMAVGDLHPDTFCQPFHPTFGCWSDDRGTLSFESEIVFQARTDEVALITVDNRGSGWGPEATYQLGVELFEPNATVTPTPAPSQTATATRTPTPSPTAEKDPFEQYSEDTCNPNAPLIRVNQTYSGLLDSRSDDDFYLIDLDAVTTYLVELTPPDDRDYDLDVLSYRSTSSRTASCSLIYSANRAGGERFLFTPPATDTYALHVYTLRDADTQRSYRLRVSVWVPTETPGPTPTDTSTPVPTVTPVPTETPTVPPTPTPPPLRPLDDGATRTPVPNIRGVTQP